MDTPVLIAVIAAIVVIAVAVSMYLRTRRSAKLRQKFGPEYRHAIERHHDRSRAEAELERIEKRVEKFHIRPLSDQERHNFEEAWRIDQGRFVDDPRGAVLEADRLIQEVMRTRGYPVADFDQRAADLSVEHPQVVDHYRTAHSIVERHKRGEASTEDFRQAMVHYRELFDDLVHEYEYHGAEVKR